MRLTALILATLLVLVPSSEAQQGQRKRILAIGEVKGFQHDSVSHALASIEKWGKETGLWDTYIRTDSELLTKKKLANNAKNLDYFDAIVFYTTGELPLTDEQKNSMVTFIREEGKGFIGIHSAADTLYQWPEYGDMIGGYFDGHPWNTFDAPIVVENKKFAATAQMPASFVLHDEIYQFRNWSRTKVDVLMRLDESKLDLTNKNVKRSDHDFAVSWIKPYGRGRVFYSTLGHVEGVYDNPAIKQMYVEAIKWALRLTEGEAAPHPKPGN